MLLFILKRIGFMALTMLAVSVVLFALLEIDKEKVAVRVIGQYTTPEQRAAWLERNGYNEPLVKRYATWLGNVATGDFGRSVRYQGPVADVLWPRVWNTVVLGAYALAIIVPLSLVLGILAGMREGSKLDRAISVTCIGTTSVPEFASAVFIAALFVFVLGILPGTSSMAGRLQRAGARHAGDGAGALRLRLRGAHDTRFHGGGDDHPVRAHRDPRGSALRAGDLEVRAPQRA